VIVPAGTSPLMVMGSGGQNPQVNVQTASQPVTTQTTAPARP
jgi:hypothetical protein